MSKWELELDDWSNANLKSLEFIYKRAQEAFDYTHEVYDSISKRAFAIITILIPILYIIIAIFGNEIQLELDSGYSNSFLAAAVVVLPAVVCLILLILIVLPSVFMPKGKEPKYSNLEFIESKELDADQQYIALIIDAIENLQLEISKNDIDNIRRANVLKNVIIAISLSLILSIIVFAYLAIF